VEILAEATVGTVWLDFDEEAPVGTVWDDFDKGTRYLDFRKFESLERL
jgi:hypothetical protein